MSNPNDIKDLVEHMEKVATFNLALAGDPSVVEKYGQETADRVKKAGLDMFRAHASATQILVAEMQARGFSRDEACSIVSSMYPNLKFM